MCGIVFSSGFSSNKDNVSKMLSRIRHRGPDGQGRYDHQHFSLGMTRLAIVDPAGGGQPLYDEATGTGIVFNGEIYNFSEIRTLLISKNFSFKTLSDTEVLLKGFLHYGDIIFKKLRGIFAGIIFSDNNITIFRDHMGIKPLYVYRDGNKLAISSEVKSLLAIVKGSIELNLPMVTDHFLIGYPTSWQTMLKGIDQLQPGTVVKFDVREPIASWRSTAFYTKPALNCVDSELNLIDSHKRKLHRIFQDAVDIQLPDMETPRILFSGGLDSTILLDEALKIRDDTVASSVNGDTYTQDADAIAKILRGFDIKSEEFSFNYSDFLKSIPDIVWIEETVSTFFAAGVYELSKALKGKCKVVLCGEGADELFCGYPEYSNKERYRVAFERLKIAKRESIEYSASLSDFLESIAACNSARMALPLIYNQNLGKALEHNHLSVFDKHFMDSHIECRVPYLDQQFVEACYEVPMNFKIDLDQNIGKLILKMIAADSSEFVRYASLRNKSGFPSTASRFVHQLEMSVKTYSRKYCGDLERLLPKTGLQALRWDIFYHIFVENKGCRPDKRLLSDLLWEQGIEIAAQ